MSTSPTDKNTMNQASQGGLQSAGTLQGYGSSNENFQNTQRNAQFGTGGTLSGMMNPASLNVTSPTGAYGTQYTNEANQVNQGANQAVQSTNRQMANQGGGLQPSGFGSAQTMNAYQNAANQKSNLFAQNTMAQQNQNLSNFWNANNAYSQAGGQAGTQAGQETEAAGNQYNNLYGNASKQKKSTLASVGSVLAGGVGAIGA